MKVLKTLVAAAGLVFAAACSDTSNQMTGIDPTFSKVGKGGFGDPHFTDETVCTLNQETGGVACYYQIAGLSAYSKGYPALTGTVNVSFDCQYPDGSIIEDKATIGVEASLEDYADKSGVAKGTIEDEKPSYFNTCPRVNFVKGTPVNLEYSLTSLLLSALVQTPKGGWETIFFTPGLIG